MPSHSFLSLRPNVRSLSNLMKLQKKLGGSVAQALTVSFYQKATTFKSELRANYDHIYDYKVLEENNLKHPCCVSTASDSDGKNHRKTYMPILNGLVGLEVTYSNPEGKVTGWLDKHEGELYNGIKCGANALGTQFDKESMATDRIMDIPTFGPLVMMFCDFSDTFRTQFLANYSSSREQDHAVREREAFAQAYQYVLKEKQDQLEEIAVDAKLGSRIKEKFTDVDKEKKVGARVIEDKDIDTLRETVDLLDDKASEKARIAQVKLNFEIGLRTTLQDNTVGNARALYQTVSSQNIRDLKTKGDGHGLWNWIRQKLANLFGIRKTGALKAVQTVFYDLNKKSSSAQVRPHIPAGIRFS